MGGGGVLLSGAFTVFQIVRNGNGDESTWGECKDPFLRLVDLLREKYGA